MHFYKINKEAIRAVFESVEFMTETEFKETVNKVLNFHDNIDKQGFCTVLYCTIVEAVEIQFCDTSKQKGYNLDGELFDSFYGCKYPCLISIYQSEFGTIHTSIIYSKENASKEILDFLKKILFEFEEKTEDYLSRHEIHKERLIELSKSTEQRYEIKTHSHSFNLSIEEMETMRDIINTMRWSLSNHIDAFKEVIKEYEKQHEVL